jgi:hypothetical protein
MINRYTLAGLLAVVSVGAIVALAVVTLTPSDDAPARSDAKAADTSTPIPTSEQVTRRPKTKLPRQRIKDLSKAARAAGCTVVTAPDEGNQHDTRELTAADYGTNPPTSGVHAPEWAMDDIYPPGNTPKLGTLVHTLEHGRIDIQYRRGTDADTIAALTALYNEMNGGYHLLLYENATDMPFAVAATAWDHLLGCPRMNDRVFDAIRAFTARFVDRGPETVP